MNNKFTYKGVEFEIANYNARKNEFEHGLKYQLFVLRSWYRDELRYIPTGAKFETKHAAKNYAIENYFIWF